MKSNDCIEMINDKFTALPGCQFAYWITPALLNDFSDGIKLGDIAAPRQGLATGDNDTFLRFWHEVAYYKLPLPAVRQRPAQRGAGVPL